MSQALQTIIDQAWENRGNLSPQSAPTDIKQAVSTVLEGLNHGSIRVAERQSVGKWNVNQWVKKWNTLQQCIEQKIYQFLKLGYQMVKDMKVKVGVLKSNQ